MSVWPVVLLLLNYLRSEEAVLAVMSDAYSEESCNLS